MSLFWNNPTGLMYPTPAQPMYYWTPTAINTGTASVTVTSITAFSVTGSGLGINTAGGADSLAFINQPAVGNIELITYVSSQSGSDPYAVAGLMVADSQTSTTPQCALIGVSPQNGVNFWYRTADGATANLLMGPSLAAPIWLRLIVSETSVVGYQSSDGVSWQTVGNCSLSLPTNYFAGFGVSSNDVTATNTASFTNFAFMTSVAQRIGYLPWNWTQTSIGSASGSFFAASGGIYKVGGSGAGIVIPPGLNDQMYFVNQPAAGNMIMIANLDSQTSTSLGAIAGLMVSDLYPTDPTESQFAWIGVSPITGMAPSGVNFFSRLSDNDSLGASTQTYLPGGPTVASPVLLKLVVSALAVEGLFFDGTNWQSVGGAAMSMPDNYFVGFAVCNGVSGLNTAKFSQVSALRTSNLITWLRADVGVIYTPGGSQPISQWLDQSGNAFNATLPSSGNPPTLVNTGINGLPSINFNGASNQSLQLPAGYSSFAGATIFIVAKPSNSSSFGQHLLDLSASPANDYNLGIDIGNSSGTPEAQLFVYTSGGSGPTTVGQNVAIGTGAQLIEAVHNGIDASLLTNSRINSSNPTMNAIANPPPPPASPPNTRSLNFIGQDASGDTSSYFNGQIAEILIYDALIDPTTRQSVEAYLLNKYQLT
jgi:hypothetical protein